jgi:hypothetical protein
LVSSRGCFATSCARSSATSARRPHPSSSGSRNPSGENLHQIWIWILLHPGPPFLLQPTRRP